MRVFIAIILAVFGAAMSADRAGAVQLRSSAIGSAGSVLDQSGRSMGFTVGLPVSGIVAVSGRRIISGFWRWELQGPAAVDEKADAAMVPRATALGVAYPNPVRGFATIPVQIAGASGVSIPTRLEVFDIAGRRVSLLIDDAVAPGYYSASWDRSGWAGERLGSGVYFVRLTAGEARKTTRMIVID